MTKDLRTRLRIVAVWVAGPVEPRFRWTPGSSILVAALIVIGTTVAFLRLPADGRNALWAEDGSVFITGALNGGRFDDLFTPYAGYLHIVPRLIAGFVTLIVPFDLVPLAVGLAACAVISTVATAVFLLLVPRVPSTTARLTVWLLIVALPVGGIETNASIANSHWYLIAGAFVALATRQDRPWSLALSTALVVSAALSDPLTLILVPLAAARVAAAEHRREWVPAIGFLVAIGVQLAFSVFAEQQPAASDRPSPGGLLRALGYRVVLATIAGPDAGHALFETLGVAALALAALIVVATLVAGSTRQGPASGMIASAAIAGAAVFLIAGWIRWWPGLDPAVESGWGGSRYSVIPTILLSLALIASIGAVASRFRHGERVAGWVTIAAVVILIIPSWATSARQPSEGWRAAVESARHECADARPGTPVELPSVPDGFDVTTTCANVVQDGEP
jgi:hypothetical protein